MIPSISPRFGNAVLAAAKKHVQKQKTYEAKRNAEIAEEEREKKALINGALKKMGYKSSLDRDTKILIEETLIFWEEKADRGPKDLRAAIQTTLSPNEIYALGRFFVEHENRTRNQPAPSHK